MSTSSSSVARHAPRLACALLLLLPFVASLRATNAEEAPTLEALLDAYEAADRANDVEQRVALLPQICRLAADATYDPKDDEARRRVEGGRRRAHSLCRRAIVHPRRVLILAGLEGYGILALPGSSDDLKNHAGRQAAEHRPQAVRLGAIAAWGRIHDPGTHVLLTDHLRLASTDPEARERALAAVEALKGFREVPRGLKRFALLRDVMLLFTGLRDASGVNVRFIRSASASQWYSLLEQPLVVLFNVLSGQTHISFTECEAWWRANRHEVQAGRL